MKYGIGIAWLLAISATALGSIVSAELMLDAAELDRFGQPFETFSAFRVVVDNSQGLTDLVDVRFKLDYGGTLFGSGSWNDDDPDNPWRGAPGLKMHQIINGVKYTTGTCHWIPTDEWLPAFWVDPTPKNPDDWESEYQLEGIIPAGIRWDRAMKIFGEDITVFQEVDWKGAGASLDGLELVAEGTVTIGTTETTLYDLDPMPQTVPEPVTLCILLLGGLLLLNRKR